MLRFVFAFAIGLLASAALAERRVALVIGNSNYANATALANPTNDARALSAKLERIGFEVMRHENLGGQAMRVALGQFTEAALNADLALVFYAGHGIEMSGRNYLIPVDAKMSSEATAQFETVALDDVMAAVQEAGTLGIVLLDACRDNPFANKMERKNGTRAVSRGLAPVVVEQAGLIVGFATTERSTADDGDGANSPYTTALLEVLDEPGLEIGMMFRKVRTRVAQMTQNRQLPVQQMQLPDKAIYLVPGGEEPTPPKPRFEEDTGPVAKVPTAVFLDAVNSGELDALVDFASRYPDHPRAEDAKRLIYLIQDETYWQQVIAEDSEQAYRRYLIVYNDGQHVDEATARLAALTKPEPKPLPDPTPTPTPAPNPPPVASGPSFNCSKASTPVERAICADAGLAQQDGQLAQAYSDARSRGWVSSSNQRVWIRERDAACTGSGWNLYRCIGTIGEDRINALRSGRLYGNVSPGFSCGKASTAVERAICSSDVLGRQDRVLLDLYKRAGSSARSQQRNWIRQRESRCGGQGSGVALCVAQYTAARISVLAR